MLDNNQDAGPTEEESDNSIQMITAVNNNFVRAPAPKGVLAKLFRKLCVALDLGAFGWQQLMQQYLDNPANGVKNNPKDRATARGNLNKELIRETLSWKVFLKAVRFFGAVRADFTVRLELPSGKVVKSTVTMVDRIPVHKKKLPDPYELPEDQVGLTPADWDAAKPVSTIPTKRKSPPDNIRAKHL